MSIQSARQTAQRGKQEAPFSSPRAFTLVELLVVITIIGMLAALLLPAVNSAREAGRQTVCMNNQRNYANAVQQYVFAKGYYPGYRQLLKVVVDQSAGTTQPAVINWQVALMPYLSMLQVYQAIQTGTIGQTNSAQSLPYWELSVCPSDHSISGHSNPWTSYVANTGLLDQLNTSGTLTTINVVANGNAGWSGSNPPLESSANGIFQDQVLGTGAPSATNSQNFPLLKSATVLPEQFKHGQTATLMISENIDAHYYNAYDDASTTPTRSIPILGSGTTTMPQSQWPTYLTSITSWGDCWERGAGFIWWDTSTTNSNSPPSPPLLAAPPNAVAGINGAKGDYDPGTIGWPISPSDTTAITTTTSTVPTANSNYAARPASGHPGGVVVVFAGGNTRFIRDDIDYPVYCLLMTPNGANATTNSYISTSTSSTVTFPPAQSWQKFSPVNDDSF